MCLITFLNVMFLWDCALKPVYLYVQMLIDWICKGIGRFLIYFLKENVITFV